MHLWIDQAAALQALLDRGGGTRVMGVDTEFMRVDTFYPQLALLQVRLGDEIGLIDPLALPKLDGLADRLSDPAQTIVMHSASEDLEALAPALPTGIGKLFDTQIAAAMTGFGLGLSYQKLVAAITGVDLPKAETRSDWLKRPLSAQQLDYAAHDVIHLSTLYDELGRRLNELERREWHAEDCARLLEKSANRDVDPQPQRTFRNAAEWPREQQARLRRLLLWRDVTARRIDKPRPWVLDDTRIAEFTLRPPRDVEELAQRGKGLRALRSAQRDALFDEIKRPLEPSEFEFEPIIGPPNPVQKRALAAMKDHVNELASDLDLPEGLLCARRNLETLVFDGVWPAALEGWRKPLLHDDLMPMLP